MADRYWVGGTGTWDGTNTTNWSATSGGAGGASVPTSADNVFFNASSGSAGNTVTIVVGVCNNISFTGSVVTFAGTGTLDSSSLTISVPNASVFTFNGTFTNSTQSTSAHSLTFGTGTYTGLTFAYNVNHVATVTLSSNFSSGTGGTGGFRIYFNASGTVNISSRTLTIGHWRVYGTTGTITTTSSSITTYDSGNNTWIDERTGSQTYVTVVVNNPNDKDLGFLNSGNRTFSALTITGQHNFDSSISIPCFQFLGSGQLTVTTLTITGSTAQNRLHLVGQFPTTISITNKTVSNVDFEGITFTGTGAPVTGTALGDCGGCSGVTFTTATTRYLIAAASWQLTSSWSATSGGASGASTPLPQDTIVLDANTPAGTHTVNISRIGNLTISSFTRTFVLSNISLGPAVLAYGNLSISGSGFTWTNRGIICFRKNGATLTANSNKTLECSISIKNSCTLSLTSNITVANAVDIDANRDFSNGPISSGGGTLIGSGSATSFSCGTILTLEDASTITAGTLTSISFRELIAVDTGTTINMGSATWTSTDTTGTFWNVSSSCTLNSGTSTISLNGTTSTNTLTFSGGGKSYYNLQIAGTGTGTVAISGDNSFNNITSTRTTAYTITFPASGTNNFANFTLAGANTSNRITVKSSSSGTRATLNYTGATFVTGADFLSVQDISGTPTNKWYVGNGSSDLGNNLNVYFTSPFGGGLFFGSNF